MSNDKIVVYIKILKWPYHFILLKNYSTYKGITAKTKDTKNNSQVKKPIANSFTINS